MHPSLKWAALSCMLPSLGFAADDLNRRSADTQRAAGYRVVWDDFTQPFRLGPPGSPDGGWSYRVVPGFVADDGVVTTDPVGKMTVKSPGSNAQTGNKPAFTKTVGQWNGAGVRGLYDRMKWVVGTSHVASTGFRGFDADPGKALSCEATVSGRTYGTGAHPFGTLVDDPNSDYRLGAAAMTSFDEESQMSFDFYVTNSQLYVAYQRLATKQGPGSANYAAFTHMVPVATRKLGTANRLKISYTRSTGTVAWFVDGVKVHSVNKLGFRLPRASGALVIDNGGTEQAVDVRQLDCGMGLFTMLDGFRPSDIGLVKLEQGSYFDPNIGEPIHAPFFDEQSLPGNRLWGQGAEMSLKKYVVSSLAASN